LTGVLKSHDLAADGAVKDQLETERIVHELDEAPLEVRVVTRAPADGTAFDVGMIRVRVLHFIMNAGSDAVKGS
jgi:hypothetical protein